MRITELVTGGQTGVESAVFDFARDHGIPCSGFYSDLAILDNEPSDPIRLNELDGPTEDFSWRNVRRSDAVLIIQSSLGYSPTALAARENAMILNKPRLVTSALASKTVFEWLDNFDEIKLHITGAKDIEWPRAYERTYTLLEKILTSEA